MTTPTMPAAREPTSRFTTPLRILLLLVLLFVFLVGVKGMGDGFKLLGKDVLEKFFAATENPFIGLIVGILATALVQSSSVTTSMIVGLVASPENPLPFANAVPMIMGANIGTTVTNMIVSMAHVGRREEFRRAFAVATVHDFFNIMAVAILLPLELATGYLQKTSGLFVSVVSGLTGAQYESPIKGAIAEGVHPIKELTTVIFSSPQGQGILLALISGGLIFMAPPPTPTGANSITPRSTDLLTTSKAASGSGTVVPGSTNCSAITSPTPSARPM